MYLKRFGKIQRLLPPNVDCENYLSGIAAVSLIALIFSVILFFTRLHDHLRLLFYYDNGEVGRMMTPFGEVLGSSLVPIIILMIVALMSSILLYASFYQGSRSIYLMHRLSDKRELRRCIWTIPLVWAASAFVLVILMFWVFYGAYHLMTPAEFLEDHQLMRLWQDLSAGKIGG